MILSHARRFIFIKTPKTASTSIEVALSSLCGHDDVITPILGNAIIRTPDAQNYMRGSGEHSRERDYFNHMPLAKVMEYAGSDVRGYRNIAFVRNPWDRQVSLYHFYAATDRASGSFQEWMETVKPLSSWGMITLNGKLALDSIGRYESLSDDVTRLCRLFDVPPLDLPRLKTGFRPDTGYHQYYTPELRDRVAGACAKEIAAFGYSY